MVTLVPICAIMTFVSLMPISVPIAESYDLSVLYVNSASIAQTLTQITMAFLSIWMYDKFSTLFVVRVATFILWFGVLLRAYSLVTQSFWPVFLG